MSEDRLLAGLERARPHLSLVRGSLKIGGIPAKTLAEKYGTPLYVTDLDRVNERFDAAIKTLASRYKNVLLAFAYKSNSTFDVVGALSRRGAGATVVSLAGLDLAKACDVDPRNVVFDGPSKSKKELEGAIRAGVGMINAESTQEVEYIESLCAQTGVETCRVGFRVNFGIGADTHVGLATGSSEHKFGVAREEVIRFCRTRASRLRRVKLVGLHCHIGSQIFDPAGFMKLAAEMVRLADELEQREVEVEELNFGGGLGFRYGQEKELGFGEYADATVGTYVRLNGGRRSGKVRLVFELGRSIVADSTVLLTRVNYLKRAGATEWALVDAGMNDFLRPSLYGAYHEIVPAHTRRKAPAKVRYSIGGPVCESTDTFGAKRRLGVRLARGDIIAILDTGAYGVSMASHYNMRPLPMVAVVSGGRDRVAAAENPYPRRSAPSDSVRGRRYSHGSRWTGEQES
jgi:diaminopimelate decarboxylase